MLVWAAVIVAVGLVPFVSCARSTPEGWVWRGWVCLPWDQDSYLTWAYQAYEGNLLFDMKYTSEPQRKIHFRPLMLLMGLTGRWFDLSLTRVFHIFTAVIGYLLLVFSYALCRLVFPSPGRRVFAFLLISFSAGASWLLPPGYLQYITATYKILPVDRWIPEGNVFLTLMTNANYAAATLGMVLSLLFFLLAAKRRNHLFSFLAGLSCASLVLVHPPDAVTIFLVLSLFMVVRSIGAGREERRFRLISYAVYAAMTLAAVLYQYVIFMMEPTFASWAKMTKIVSPAPYSFVIGYGFLFVMALYGAYRMFPRMDDGKAVVLCWLVVGFLLYYFPVTFQARVIMGYHIPVSMAACYGVFAALGGTGRKVRLAVLAAFFLLTIPSNVRTVVNFSVVPPRVREGYYIERGEVDAVNRLGEVSSSDDIVLSSQDIGSYIPGRIGCYVYIGHGSETVDLDRKKGELGKFLDAATPHSWRKSFLSESGIDYVYAGRHERRLRKTEGGPFVDFDPNTAAYLEKIYSKDGVEIFKVIGSNNHGVVREE